MPKRSFAVAVIAAFAPLAVAAQTLQPGEWEFNTSTTAALLPKPQTNTFKRCITKEEGDNPEAWLGRQTAKNDCKFTPGEKTADTVKWQISCPKTGMEGSGTAKIGPGTLESDMKMTGEIQGRKFDLTTKMNGRRLGPCSSTPSS